MIERRRESALSKKWIYTYKGGEYLVGQLLDLPECKIRDLHTLQDRINHHFWHDDSPWQNLDIILSTYKYKTPNVKPMLKSDLYLFLINSFKGLKTEAKNRKPRKRKTELCNFNELMGYFK